MPHLNSDDLRKPEEQQRLKCLKHYATRPVTEFMQFDGFHVGADCDDWVMRPDKDGDSCFGLFMTHELMHGADVRVLIKAGASKETAIRLLKKLLEWVMVDYGRPEPEKEKSVEELMRG